MTTEEIKEKLATEEYGFLRKDARLKDNIILLTLGGSYAYGTNTETSDLDIRGIALNSAREILVGRDFEVITEENTDTVIYSFNKIINLLCNNNPNTLEMLGCKPEHYFVLSPIGKELKDNARMFLSKKAIFSFGGYANQQLRRLENKASRLVSQSENEKHIFKTIENAWQAIISKYAYFPEDAIRLYIDKAVSEDYDTEIFADVNLHKYPLRDYKGLWNELNCIVKAYAKIGQRNKKAIEHNKLGKHMMHLIRLYYMCLDILEREEIVTYREKEHALLMDIRRGKYLDGNRQPTAEFYEMLDELDKRFDYAKENTALPETPDRNKIDDFVASVNARIVKGDL